MSKTKIKYAQISLLSVLILISWYFPTITIKNLLASSLTAKTIVIIMPAQAEMAETMQEPTQTYAKGLFTAYNSTVEQCGKDNGITASGKLGRPMHTLACPPEYKMGTEIEIKGYGVYVCEDRGGAIKENRFDIYFGGEDKVSEAKKFGSKNLEYKILK
ncbi:MAG: 3D domain-containing protein [Candidatus Omnitrophota bacterium]|jgi:3D (Asp-Asp-Asp) domain-containing protein